MEAIKVTKYTAGILYNSEADNVTRNVPTRFMCIPGNKPVNIPINIPASKAVKSQIIIAFKEKIRF